MARNNHGEMLARIDERTAALPDMKEKLDKLAGKLAAHSESIRWLTWSARLGYATILGALVYFIQH